MACQYFMVVFACDITDDTFRASLGFNFSMLVLAHLIIGFIALMTQKIINVLPALKKIFFKIKDYWPKLKEKLCKPRKSPKEQYKLSIEEMNDIERAKAREGKEESKEEEEKADEEVNEEQKIIE